jgi:hypothetical protein
MGVIGPQKRIAGSDWLPAPTPPDLSAAADIRRFRRINPRRVQVTRTDSLPGSAERSIGKGKNDTAIVLQKASTLTCNDIELQGTFKGALTAMSGSVFFGAFRGGISGVVADAGASIHIVEMKNQGRAASVSATRGAVVSLPDRLFKMRCPPTTHCCRRALAPGRAIAFAGRDDER